MAIIWHDAKNEANKAKHGLAFEDFAGFDATPLVRADTRVGYDGRFQAFGTVAGTRCMIAYIVEGSDLRLISFRRAHEKEFRRHGLD